MKTRPIVIIGGGFAGVRAALDLDRLLGGDLEQPIYLVNPTPYHTYTPRFFDILSSTSPKVATIPFDEIFDGTSVHFLAEEVTHIDVQDKVVTTEKRRLPYADLVIAIENQPWPADDKHEEYGSMLTCNDLADILAARTKILHAATMLQSSPKVLQGPHTVMVVGGGMRGVEFVAGLHAFFKKELPGRRVPIQFVLAEAEKRILPTYIEHLSDTVAKYLLDRGIKIKLKSRLTPDELRKQLKGGDTKNHTIVWAVGMQAHPLVAKCKGVPHHTSGRLEVLSSLQVRNHDDVWAAGDSAAVTNNQSAQGSIEHGRHIAKGIIARRAGHVPPAYVPTATPDIIQLAPNYAVTWSRVGVHDGTFPVLRKQYRDLRYFRSILPVATALRYWRKLAHVTHEGGMVCYRLHD